MPANLTSAIILVFLQSWHMLAELWYYIVAGILAGSAASVFIPTARLSKLFQAPRGIMLPVATAAGMASPLCTYGTVPFFLGLLKRGMPFGPVAAFLVASAAVNPQMIVLTAGAVGPRIAAAQVASVFFMALIIGRFASAYHGKNLPTAELQTNGDLGVSDRHKIQAERFEPWKQFWRTSLGIGEHVIIYFVVGVLVANAILVFSQGAVYTVLLGAHQWFAIPLAGVLAIPLFMCSGAVIPFLAVGSDAGMHPGGILAFLIVGPATRIAPLVGMSSIFTRRALGLYVMFVLLFAIACGLVYDLMLEML